MEFKKQRIQHRIEMEGIARKTVKGNRSTSVQQTWSHQPRLELEDRAPGESCPQEQKTQQPKAMTDFLCLFSRILCRI